MPPAQQTKVLVIGSINADLVAAVDRLPLQGETVLAKDFQQHLGGKGANQAVAAALLGADVAMIGCVGDDAAGAAAVAGLKETGVDVAQVRVVPDVPTGTALITVGSRGENTIVVVPGANGQLAVEHVRDIRRRFGEFAALVLQLEIPDQVVAAVVQEVAAPRQTQRGLSAQSAASSSGIRSSKPWIVFNPSPFRPSGLLPSGVVDVLLVNEVEAEAMSGIAVKTPEDAAEASRRLLVDVRPGGCVVVTLGAQGAVARAGAGPGETGSTVYVPALSVEAVDTTGAGDVFTGAFVARLSAGAGMEEALRFATAAAALTVTRAGAQSSFPKRHEVEAMLDRVGAVRPLDD